MKIKFALFIYCLLAICGSVWAQGPASDIQNFSGDGISFSYPAGWKLTDKSAGKIQQFNLTPEIGNALIMIIAYRPDVLSRDALTQLKNQIARPRLLQIAKSFDSPKSSDVCIETKSSKIPGVRFSGFHDHESSVGDSYSFVLDNKYLNLVFMKEDKESSKADPAWQTLIDTLRIKNRLTNQYAMWIDSYSGQILNNRAIKLPWPVRVSSELGKIQVQVTVDEEGNVISAKTISGSPYFLVPAANAAKDAKFKPFTMCGQPVKVTGLIVYEYEYRAPEPDKP